jgi:hypothetical protein
LLVRFLDRPLGERVLDLLDDALDYLASLRLVRQRPEGVEPLPAIARYRVTAEEATAS